MPLRNSTKGQSLPSFAKHYSQTQLTKLPNRSINTSDCEREPITALHNTVEPLTWAKRYLTGLLSRHMPPEGIDENLESALYNWHHYRDQTNPPSMAEPSPSTETVTIVGIRTSPGMVFEG